MWHHWSVIYIWAEVRLTHRKPDIPLQPSHSSALLDHSTSRGGVQFFLDEPETRTQFEYVPESRGKAGPHKKEVP